MYLERSLKRVDSIPKRAVSSRMSEPFVQQEAIVRDIKDGILFYELNFIFNKL
jgi:hypothetical protein